MMTNFLFDPVMALSLKEMLGLWGEMVECFHGVHGYGGDTAEIYAYRLQPYSPMAHTHRDEVASRQCANTAAGALVGLCLAFEGDYDCRITIDNMSLNHWLAESQTGGVPFNHRAYVKVEPRKGAGK